MSCSNHTTTPKPKAFLYNEVSVPNYVFYKSACGYSFFINSENQIDFENCNVKIKNSSLNSILYLSSINIKDNFSLIDSDFTKKIQENSIMLLQLMLASIMMLKIEFLQSIFPLLEMRLQIRNFILRIQLQST